MFLRSHFIIVVATHERIYAQLSSQANLVARVNQSVNWCLGVLAPFETHHQCNAKTQSAVVAQNCEFLGHFEDYIGLFRSALYQRSIWSYARINY